MSMARGNPSGVKSREEILIQKNPKRLHYQRLSKDI